MSFEDHPGLSGGGVKGPRLRFCLESTRILPWGIEIRKVISESWVRPGMGIVVKIPNHRTG
ncbi:MAG: hypothetical protein CMF59_07400 [Leptospiraceae bacterium]|nr:hypothetical protein [Leptospiraceae bacterium]